MILGWTQRIFTLLVVVTLLAACADEVVNPPKELADIEEKFSVQSSWVEVIGQGDEEKFNSLSPALWQDKIITADVDGLITAFDIKSGKVIWETNLKQPLSGGVTANAGLVAVGTKNAQVHVLDVNDGKQLWHVNVTTEVLAKPAISDGRLVVRTPDGRIFAYSLATQKQEWFYDRIIPNLTLRGTSAAVATSGVVITGFANGKMAAFNLRTGDMLWEQSISAPRGSSEISRIVDVDSTPVVYSNYLYAAGFNGFAIAMDLTNGRYLWREDASVTEELLVDARRVYLVDTKGRIVALDRITGEEVWTQEGLLYRKPTGAADNQDYVVVGDFEGYLHWLDKSTGEFVARIHLDRYGIGGTPIVTDEHVIATTRYGYIHVLENPLATSSEE
ncbi:outer membrane protein assembly factor BamB [Kangiella koreensis]|uniref:Outer membrane protein assembly factor BamB n=1 Tax=Kangiella koreensis (strain DSM 16069 / JCM 12317 / KCTC 12182 / SW-125) TaxID=523791 RepID=BAMB_KANKD|nr:outer membrane protein assembly factor BamB [Kangiella koreensis]C7R5S3.1 RecName: Full=Outer membrane protein assembly factor BamB; Flags: Precursor [Kangiella koreensis DSM 16069]ACV27247.1 outer membrane assembly lipoprotein YfgL [Kangiella koreensis DSM 16069]